MAYFFSISNSFGKIISEQNCYFFFSAIFDRNQLAINEKLEHFPHTIHDWYFKVINSKILQM